MIFVTVGTQLPFDRLVKMMDEIAPSLEGEEIIVQGLQGKYRPRHLRVVDYLDAENFERTFDEARVVVAHAGVGTIISAMRRRKPLIVVARDASLGEHRNDHQKATAIRFADACSLYVASSAEEILAGIRSLPVPAPLPESPSPALAAAIMDIIDA